MGEIILSQPQPQSSEPYRNPMNNSLIERRNWSSLPPGFRFHPTDEELVLYYLKRKICNNKESLNLAIVAEIDIYKWDPQDLPGQSVLKNGDKKWYYFCKRERKYPNGSRASRQTANGYWKITGRDRNITYKGVLVGSKKTLVFYRGRAPSGERTDWVIQEYTLDQQALANCPGVDKGSYVLCKVYNKKGSGPMHPNDFGAAYNDADWDNDENLVEDTQSNREKLVLQLNGHVALDVFQVENPCLLRSNGEGEISMDNEEKPMVNQSYAGNYKPTVNQSYVDSYKPMVNQPYADNHMPMVNQSYAENYKPVVNQSYAENYKPMVVNQSYADNYSAALPLAEHSSVEVPKNMLKQITYDQAETSSRGKQVSKSDDKAKQSAEERAEEVQANLDPQFPSFIKTMLPSHVNGGYGLGLPAQFCNAHFPRQDIRLTLVDENQKEYSVKFFAEKPGLSSGWKEFSLGHELVEGDALVFHLVEPLKFQVYIIRAHSLSAIDGVISLLTLDSRSKRATQNNSKTSEKSARKRQKTALLSAIPTQKDDKSGSDSEEVSSEVLQGSRFSESPPADIQQVTFSISVNGLIIDPEIPREARIKYYKLCCSQNTYLHANLSEGINPKLAAGAISELVDISDSIKASKISTSKYEFAAWDKSLGALQQLGMEVGFLRARLQRLRTIALESEVDSKRYCETQIGRVHIEKEIRSLRAKLGDFESGWKMLDSETKTLEAKARRHEQRFQLEADSPW